MVGSGGWVVTSCAFDLWITFPRSFADIIFLLVPDMPFFEEAWVQLTSVAIWLW